MVPATGTGAKMGGAAMSRLTGLALTRALRVDAEDCLNDSRRELIMAAVVEIEKLIAEVRHKESAVEASVLNLAPMLPKDVPEGTRTYRAYRMSYQHEYMVPIEVAWAMEREINALQAEVTRLNGGAA
jgi:hypothetical protein